MVARTESFQDLTVYRTAFQLERQVSAVSEKLSGRDVCSMADEFLRVSRSVGANISEAWDEREYAAHFISKLSDADGDLAETENWVDTFLACGYISNQERVRLLSTTRQIGTMLAEMMSEAHKWCSPGA